MIIYSHSVKAQLANLDTVLIQSNPHSIPKHDNARTFGINHTQDLGIHNLLGRYCPLDHHLQPPRQRLPPPPATTSLFPCIYVRYANHRFQKPKQLLIVPLRRVIHV